MRQFYDVTQKIKDTCIAFSDVNTVTLGDAADVDTAKQSIYPLVHIVPGNVSHEGNTLVMTLTVMFLDIVDFNKDDLRDVLDTFHGTTNLQDVWNTQLANANRLIVEMQRGSLHRERYQVENTTLNPLKDHVENLLAGWVTDLAIRVPNTEICVDG